MGNQISTGRIFTLDNTVLKPSNFSFSDANKLVNIVYDGVWTQNKDITLPYLIMHNGGSNFDWDFTCYINLFNNPIVLTEYNVTSTIIDINTGTNSKILTRYLALSNSVFTNIESYIRATIDSGYAAGNPQGSVPDDNGTNVSWVSSYITSPNNIQNIQLFTADPGATYVHSVGIYGQNADIGTINPTAATSYSCNGVTVYSNTIYFTTWNNNYAGYRYHTGVVKTVFNNGYIKRNSDNTGWIIKMPDITVRAILSDGLTIDSNSLQNSDNQTDGDDAAGGSSNYSNNWFEYNFDAITINDSVNGNALQIIDANTYYYISS